MLSDSLSLQMAARQSPPEALCRASCPGDGHNPGIPIGTTCSFTRELLNVLPHVEIWPSFKAPQFELKQISDKHLGRLNFELYFVQPSFKLKSLSARDKMVVPVILVHGGAGNISDAAVEAKVQGVRRAVEAGYRVLSGGGSSLDAAQACVEVMEEDGAFNAGRGSVLNCDGEVEMDAIIMEGTNLNLGSVGGVKNILHPVALARRVMEKSRAAMLVGSGANRFALEEGFPTTPAYKLVTTAAVTALEMFLNNPEGAECEFECGGVGTVGAVVVDKDGRVACATSTGGTTGKPSGRLGDTPIPGCGGYADDQVGAVSTTGRGESIMRVCLSQRVLNLMKEGKSAQEATEEALEYMRSTVGDTAGAITVSCTGDVGIAFISKRMAWGLKRGEEPVLAGVDKPFPTHNPHNRL